MNNTTCMLTSNFKFQVIYEVNIEVIVFTVLDFSQRLFKLGLKMRSFSKSTFLGLLRNVLYLRICGKLPKMRTPENAITTIFKTIIIFLRNLVVCSGF